jgi:hypothetical protein
MFKNTIVIIGGAVVLLAVLFCIYVTSARSSVQPEKVSAENSLTQQREDAMKQIVSSFLKSPGSAKFVDLVVRKKSGAENQYVAFGDVDSQNSFGALLRTHFNLTAIYPGGDVGDTKNWQVDSLDMGDTNLISSGKLQDPPLQLTQELITLRQQTEDLYRGMPQYGLVPN